MTIEFGSNFTVEPFGTNHGSGDPNVGEQTFLNCTVVDFNASAAWDGQSSTCNINLIEDPNKPSPERIQSAGQFPVITSPQFFEVVDATGGLIWEFNGIINDIHREASIDSKTYAVTLENPASILESVVLVLDKYAGRGKVLEAIAPNTPQYLEYGHNNSNVTWSEVYNVMNVFGAYENNEYGILNITDPTTGAGNLKGGYGLANRNHNGMRVVDIVRALDFLINRNTLGYWNTGNYSNSMDTSLGGNILYGTSNYNVGTGSPYYYGIDILDFYSQIESLIVNIEQVRIPDQNITLLEFISRLADMANVDFYIDLDEFADVPTVGFQSTGVGLEGGMIKIYTRDKNQFPSGPFPLALISQVYLQKEKGDVGQSNSTHPGTDPGSVNDPLDYDWYNPAYYPTGEQPYGGDFPVDDWMASNSDRVTKSSMGLTATKEVVGRMVIGDYQTRMNNVDRDHIYHYWGDLRLVGRSRELTGETDSSVRNIPVVTPLLPPDDIEDFIFIDIQNVFDNTVEIEGFIYKGVYAASMLEIRCAMAGFEQWMAYMLLFKPSKISEFEEYIGNGIRNTLSKLYNKDGTLTYLGKSLQNNLTANPFFFSDTSKKNISPTTPQNLSELVNSNYSLLVQKLHEQIKAIGDEHYGKSWFVTMPAFTTKFNEDAESIIGNYVRSWDISSSAYIDPPQFSLYKAPQSPDFIEDGRVTAYVNWEANTTIPDLSALGITISPFSSFQGFDFSKYNGSDFAYSQIGLDFWNHFKLDSIDNKYRFLSSQYFSQYNRGLFRLYTTRMIDQYTSKIESIIDNLFLFPDSYLGVNTGIAYIDDNRDQSGIGLLPFVLVKTKEVAFHFGDNSTQISVNTAFRQIQHLLAKHNYLSQDAAFSPAFHNQNLPKAIKDFAPYPALVPPNQISIPQRSNKYVYGPWVTRMDSDLAGKMEVVEIGDLAPENYIIPTAFGATSGLAGMNYVGQIEADSIDNFNFFAEEDGSFSVPGFPEISGFGQSLVGNGPWITDINVRMGTSTVETSYNYRTHAPRYDKIGKQIIDQFKRLSKKRVV